MRAFARQGEGGRERVCVYDGLKESEGQGKQMCLCLTKKLSLIRGPPDGRGGQAREINCVSNSPKCL